MIDAAAPPPFDVAAVRARFPALADRAVVHADAPGGTQVPQAVVDAIGAYLVGSNANAHGAFAASRATDDLCERVRDQVAAFLGGHPEGVVFGPSMTALTWRVARAVGRRLQPGDELVCTQLDHDANVSPWLRVAEERGAHVRMVPLDAVSGRLDTSALAEVVTARTRVVAFPGASNALGTVVDPAPFVAAARLVGAMTYLDAVHAAPHVPLDQRAAGIDIVTCSPYKFCGPHMGVLSADPVVLAELTPDRIRPAPDAGPERWQSGTAPFELIAGTGAAVTHLEQIGGMATVRWHEAGLTRRFLAGLGHLPAVHLHGPPGPEDRTPTFAVTVEGHSPDAVTLRLAERGIATWAGHYYALEPMRALGLLEAGGAVRIGFAHYADDADVDRVLEALADHG